MAGKVTIYDSTTVMYEFQVVTNVRHVWEPQFDIYNVMSLDLPPADHLKVVVHTITVDFELTDQGAYAGGGNPGSTGSIWKQMDLLQALKAQPSTHDYYQLAQEDDTLHNTVNSNAWKGIVKKIMPERAQATMPKMTGILVFMETDDVRNF